MLELMPRIDIRLSPDSEPIAIMPVSSECQPELKIGQLY